jgi:hypothetical protein
MANLCIGMYRPFTDQLQVVSMKGGAFEEFAKGLDLSESLNNIQVISTVGLSSYIDDEFRTT